MIPPFLLAKFGPSMAKIGIVAAVGLAIWAHGGWYWSQDARKAAEAQEQSYKVAAAQAAGARKAREQMWQEAITVAGEKWNAANKTVVADRDNANQRLREHASSARLRITSAPAQGSCPSGPGIDELVRKGEELEELVSSAARLGNALNLCLGSWPR